MTTPVDFTNAARGAFSFLVDDFGFVLTEETARGPSAHLKYETPRRRVIVHFEAESGSWIELNDVQREGGEVIAKKRFNLERLLRRRALSVPDERDISTRLRSLAEALRYHFSAFLLGEPLPDQPARG